MVLLINADEVVDISFVEGKNFTRAKIKDTQILTSQYNWIKPVLGKNFYNSLLSEIKDDSIGENNQMLLDDYIKPCLAYYVKFVVMPDLMLQLTNKGGQKAHSEFSTTISASERGEKREAAKRTADTLKQILVDYLNDNHSDFPNYQRSSKKGKKPVRGGILLGSRRKKRNYDDDSYVNTSNKKTYDYEANEDGYFELDFSDIKATGEQISIVVKNSNGQLVDEFDIDVNYDTANQTLEAWILTEQETDYSGTITVTVNK